MKIFICAATVFSLFPPAAAQESSSPTQGASRPFPGPDFVLHDKDLKPPKSGLVMGPPKSDGKGGATGSFAIYGGASLIQVSSLSFSGDGKLLAVGSTPGRIDLWDVENRKKLRTLDGGTTVALSADGSQLAKDGNGIELLDVATGNLRKRIPWEVVTSDPHVQHTLTNLMFNPAGTLLLVSANGMIDSVYDVSSGQLVTTLENTQRAQFSRDGAWIIGGNAKHLIAWNTKDWSKLRDLPNGPDYVTRIVAFPENDLVIVGGQKSARLLHLSAGDEIAKVGNGWTNFAAFNANGTVLFTYTQEGFGVWDQSGNRYCFAPDIGNGTTAVSANDRWLAGGIANGANSISIWNLQSALTACGFVSGKKSQ